MCRSINSAYNALARDGTLSVRHTIALTMRLASAFAKTHKNRAASEPILPIVAPEIGGSAKSRYESEATRRQHAGVVSSEREAPLPSVL